MRACYRIKLLLVLVGVCFVTAIVSYALISPTMRMIADDFCLTYDIQSSGVLGNVVKQYTLWSGHYTDVFLKGVAYETLGLSAHMVMPLVLYGIWWAGSVALLALLARWLGWQHPSTLGALLGTFYVFMVLHTIPTRSVIYWLNAIMPYVAPIAGFTVLTAFWLVAISQPKRLWVKALLLGVGMFVLGGMHVMFIPLALGTWIAVLLLGVRLLPAAYRLACRWTTGGAVAGTLVAAFISFSAPGNWRRFSATTDSNTGGLGELLLLALESVFKFWLNPFVLVNLVLFVGISAGVVVLWYQLGMGDRDASLARWLRRYRWQVSAVMGVWVLGYAGVAVAFPALGSGDVSLRVLLYARAAQLAAALALGIVWGISLVDAASTPKRIYAVLAFVVLAAFVLSAYRVVDNVRLLPDHRVWAAAWDARHEALLALSEAGTQRAEVALFPKLLPKFLGPSTDDMLTEWTRSCMQRFYGIAELIPVTELPNGAAARATD